MKIQIEFANGEVRVVESVAKDFNVALVKLLNVPIILTGKNEAFSTSMIIKLEELNEE